MRLSFSCFWGSTSFANTSPHNAWHAPRHRIRSGDANFGVGASTFPRPLMPHMSAYFAPSFGFNGLLRHWRPSLVQNSTHNVSIPSSFCLGSQALSRAAAWSTSFTASALSLAKGMPVMAAMTSASLPCKSLLSAPGAGGGGAPFGAFPAGAAGAAASKRSGRRRARSGGGFSRRRHCARTCATTSFRSCSPRRFITRSWSVSNTVKFPFSTPALTFAIARSAANLRSNSALGIAASP
mmetsp:Transcript_76013/g.220808  ORF Transcript_76013/g.220808 Transcript_76013/m.220808 type:complete len:238 (-) Transcript_76013:2374-3087(-)